MNVELRPWLEEQVLQDRRAIEAYAYAGPTDSFEIRHRPLLEQIRESNWPAEGWLEAAARCESHGRVLARHRHPQLSDENACWMPARSCHGCGFYGDPDKAVTDDLNDCPELRDMAVAFRHRDGYRQEWAP